MTTGPARRDRHTFRERSGPYTFVRSLVANVSSVVSSLFSKGGSAPIRGAHTAPMDSLLHPSHPHAPSSKKIARPSFVFNVDDYAAADGYAPPLTQAPNHSSKTPHTAEKRLLASEVTRPPTVSVLPPSHNRPVDLFSTRSTLSEPRKLRKARSSASHFNEMDAVGLLPIASTFGAPIIRNASMGGPLMSDWTRRPSSHSTVARPSSQLATEALPSLGDRRNVSYASLVSSYPEFGNTAQAFHSRGATIHSKGTAPRGFPFSSSQPSQPLRSPEKLPIRTPEQLKNAYMRSNPHRYSIRLKEVLLEKQGTELKVGNSFSSLQESISSPTQSPMKSWQAHKATDVAAGQKSIAQVNAAPVQTTGSASSTAMHTDTEAKHTAKFTFKLPSGMPEEVMLNLQGQKEDTKGLSPMKLVGSGTSTSPTIVNTFEIAAESKAPVRFASANSNLTVTRPLVTDGSVQNPSARSTPEVHSRKRGNQDVATLDTRDTSATLNKRGMGADLQVLLSNNTKENNKSSPQQLPGSDHISERSTSTTPKDTQSSSLEWKFMPQVAKEYQPVGKVSVFTDTAASSLSSNLVSAVAENVLERNPSVSPSPSIPFVAGNSRYESQDKASHTFAAPLTQFLGNSAAESVSSSNAVPFAATSVAPIVPVASESGSKDLEGPFSEPTLNSSTIEQEKACAVSPSPFVSPSHLVEKEGGGIDTPVSFQFSTDCEPTDSKTPLSFKGISFLSPSDTPHKRNFSLFPTKASPDASMCTKTPVFYGWETTPSSTNESTVEAAEGSLHPFRKRPSGVSPVASKPPAPLSATLFNFADRKETAASADPFAASSNFFGFATDPSNDSRTAKTSVFASGLFATNQSQSETVPVFTTSSSVFATHTPHLFSQEAATAAATHAFKVETPTANSTSQSSSKRFAMATGDSFFSTVESQNTAPDALQSFGGGLKGANGTSPGKENDWKAITDPPSSDAVASSAPMTRSRPRLRYANPSSRRNLLLGDAMANPAAAAAATSTFGSSGFFSNLQTAGEKATETTCVFGTPPLNIFGNNKALHSQESVIGPRDTFFTATTGDAKGNKPLDGVNFSAAMFGDQSNANKDAAERPLFLSTPANSLNNSTEPKPLFSPSLLRTFQSATPSDTKVSATPIFGNTNSSKQFGSSPSLSSMPAMRPFAAAPPNGRSDVATSGVFPFGNAT